jgi:hypothetical protein
MHSLSHAAKTRLDGYLHEVRACLQGCKTVDADEVEQNITEHIENELAEADQPVSLDELNAVLEKLGSPQQWVPEEEISAWLKMVLRLRTGPEDWRLAYISFGLFVISFLFASPGRRSILVLVFSPIIILQGTTQGILLLASFCMARAVVALAKEPDELRRKRWLTYPALIAIYLPVAIFLFGWPTSLLSIDGFTTDSLQEQDLIDGINVAALGLWWFVLGILVCAWPGILRTIFRPFADKCDRRKALAFIAVAVVLIISGAIPYIERYFEGTLF